MNSRLNKMVVNGAIPNLGGIWIDCYNGIIDKDCAGSILTRIDQRNMHFITESMKKHSLHPGQNGLIYNTDSYSPTICTSEGVKTTTKIISIPQATKDGNIQMEIGGVADLSYPTSKTRRGRVQDNGTISPSLTCNTENTHRRIEPEYRIRKLTPRECFRLMGVGEIDIDKLLESGISNSQLYKLAGNSIVVNCLAGIFRQLFVKNENKHIQLEIF